MENCSSHSCFALYYSKKVSYAKIWLYKFILSPLCPRHPSPIFTIKRQWDSQLTPAITRIVKNGEKLLQPYWKIPYLINLKTQIKKNVEAFNIWFFQDQIYFNKRSALAKLAMHIRSSALLSPFFWWLEYLW